MTEDKGPFQEIADEGMGTYTVCGVTFRADTLLWVSVLSRIEDANTLGGNKFDMGMAGRDIARALTNGYELDKTGEMLLEPVEQLAGKAISAGAGWGFSREVWRQADELKKKHDEPAKPSASSVPAS